MFKNKNLWMVLLLIFTLVTSGISVPAYAAEPQNHGTITVLGTDGANPLVPETAVQFGQNETATDALLKAVGEDGVTFDEYPWGRMISGIKGLNGDDTHYWGFFINGISAQIGSDSYFVQPGDKISFHYKDWTKPIENSVTLSIMNEAPSYPIEIIGEPNAFHLLQAVYGPDKVGFTETQFGKMIHTINGFEAKDPQFWAFYINGQLANDGAEGYVLQPGDQISFQLETYTPPSEGGDDGAVNPEKPGAGSYPDENLQQVIDAVSDIILASEIGEWEAIALNQAGKAIPVGYLDSVKQIVNEKKGKFRNITDTERYVLGIVAAGGDPANFAGYNLVAEIYNGNNVTRQGLNGVAYALIALDSGDFSIPDDALWTREKLINLLLEKQNPDGGWNWDGVSASDLDSTAMIVTALARYKDQEGIKEKLDHAVEYFAAEYQVSKINNSNTAAQMIIALSALGIDANASQFAKDSTSLFQQLLSFQTSDGGFAWQPGDKDSNGYATQQSLLALVAYQLFSQGKGSLYHFPLEVEKPDPNQPGNEETPGTETPNTETPNKETPNVEQPAVQVPAAANTADKNTGKKLPNTATDMYNLLAIGLLLMLIGVAFYMRQRKSKA